MKKCPVCQKIYGDDQTINFCEDCGVMLVDDAPSSEATADKNNKPNKNKIVIIVLSILLALAVAAAVFFVVKGTFTEKKTDAPVDEAGTVVSEEVLSEEKNDAVETTLPPEMLTVKETTTEAQVSTTLYIPSNILESMSSSETTALNTFLSNFAEVRFGDYNSSSSDYGQLIDFAIKHAYINGNSSIQSGDGNSTMSTVYADKYISRFFGRTVTYHDTSLVSYNPDSQTLHASTTDLFLGCVDYTGSEYRLCFASAFDVKKNDNGTYTVQFNILSADKDTDNFSKYYSMSHENLISYSGVNNEGSCTAVVKVSGNNLDDSFSYQLVSYDVTYR